jgi:hypothetical protein
MALTASQRITLMKEIAYRLAVEDYSLIDITLGQFDLPTGSEWNGTKDAYLLHMIKDGPDQALIDLGEHVGFHFAAIPAKRFEPAFWRKGMLRIFLTHLAIHRVFAASLQELLLDFGISCFVAHNDIEPTLEWQAEIEAALATCDGLIALLHKNFHASNWVDQEIGFAIGRGLPIFAVHLGQDPYGFIGRFQAFNGRGKLPYDLAKEIFDAFRKNKETQSKMSEVLVGLFEESGSFADAKTRVGYLEEIGFWQPSFASRIRAVAKSNSQISGSWGVPGRVETLAKKWETNKP